MACNLDKNTFPGYDGTEENAEMQKAAQTKSAEMQ